MHVVYYWGFGEFKKIKSEVTNNFWGEGTKKFDIFRLCRWFENDFGEWGWVEEESQREWVIILLAAPLFFHCLVTILMHDFLPPFVFCSKLPSDHQTTLSSMGLFLLLSILVQVDATIVVQYCFSCKPWTTVCRLFRQRLSSVCSHNLNLSKLMKKTDF